MDKYIKIPDTNSTIVIQGFMFGVEKPGWKLEDHHHDIFELTLCTEGSALQWFNEECIEFNKGDWIFLRPGVRHKTINIGESPFSYLAVHFDIDDLPLRKLLKNSILNHITHQTAMETQLAKYTSEIDLLIQKILFNKNYILTDQDIILTVTEVDKLLFQANVMAVISEYIKLIEKNNQTAQETNFTKQQFEIADEMKALLENNVIGSLNINDISETLGYSRSHCTRIFTQVYGSSPRQYYTNLKIKKAKELLLLTNKGIDEISSDLGFSSLFHFSRQFKRWTSKSPSEYRMNPTR
ncbi:helix-turn-helix domain-containing protein [Bacillus sp. ISL-18]|uniref:helix-turn-helix domain-containing protein n=1 Tax=Bacillus sp. ISL-18 TaxID=2819118 RepID=UPI001BEAC69E|nr:AraC family transcriptional regulator [Bacillus sp. ISL-18]MBT2659031.1 helix-turn-helix domain-containing protein [Bacillus sp. ISL-18]